MDPRYNIISANVPGNVESADFVDLEKAARDEDPPELPRNMKERMYMFESSPALAVALPHWRDAMLSCFYFEVKVRLLAGKFHPAESVTREIGDPKNGLLAMLFQHPKLTFTADEKAFLPKCNALRNKLIHCEPDAVRKLVQELIPSFQPPNKVQKLKFPEGATAATMLDVLKTQKGAVPVAATPSRQDGFFGWMLQAAHDGTFDLAADIFMYGIGIIGAKAKQSDQ